MMNFSNEDQVQLVFLVQTAQHLVATNQSSYTAWIAELSDHERAILLMWLAQYKAKPRTATARVKSAKLLL